MVGTVGEAFDQIIDKHSNLIDACPGFRKDVTELLDVALFAGQHVTDAIGHLFTDCTVEAGADVLGETEAFQEAVGKNSHVLWPDRRFRGINRLDGVDWVLSVGNGDEGCEVELHLLIL